MKYPFAENCYSEISDEMASIGFSRRSLGIFTSKINEDTWGWVGLNQVRRDAVTLELYPIIGVVHARLNELILSPKAKIKPSLHPTIRMPLSYLVGEKKYNTWVWSALHEGRPITVDLVRQIAESGMRFIEDFSDIESIYSAAMRFEDCTCVSYELDSERVIPAAMYLLGMKAKIPAILKCSLELDGNIGSDSDFRSFANNLLEKIR